MDKTEIEAMVKASIHDILNEEEHDGKTFLHHEVENIATVMLGKTVRKFWFAIISMIATITIGWTTLQLQVLAHERELHGGNFYTMERGISFESLIMQTLEAREVVCNDRHNETNRRLDRIETGVDKIQNYLINQ